jgi:hypothetical protein
MEIQKLKERIQDAIALINSSDYDSLALGVSELESVRPELQVYVDNFPNDSQGHMEISKTYQIPIFIAMKLDTINDRPKTMSLMMQYIGKSKEYAEKGKFHLEQYCNMSNDDPKMISAARAVIAMLDNILKR